MNYIIGFAIGCVFTSLVMCKFSQKFGLAVMEKVYEDVEKQDEKLIKAIKGEKHE